MNHSTFREPLAIVGMECRLPGADGVPALERLLFAARSGIGELAPELLQPELYFDSRKAVPGKTYSRLAGMVPERPVPLVAACEAGARYDEVHLRFCDVACRAWNSLGLADDSVLRSRTGVFVGHSGATRLAGPANLALQIGETLDFLREVPAFCALPLPSQQRVMADVAAAIRAVRPESRPGDMPRFEGYHAAALVAKTLGLGGPRAIVDAACASSLYALNQARLAIAAGRIDAAIVGGATTNGVDNLILFSQSQACSERGSCPFDQAAGGLVSSEGYAAIVVLPASLAEKLNLSVLATIAGVGISSDGRGKSLWAPRSEGQQLAIRRADPDSPPLSVDYLEAHATSTQLGDATELHAVDALLHGEKRAAPLLIGSVKSNLGHTLETAGLAGLIKLIVSMRRGEIPPTLHLRELNREYDWSRGAIKPVGAQEAWPARNGRRRGGVSAFGIGGLDAHVVIEQSGVPRARRADGQPHNVSREPIAIVGRGVVLPGAHNVRQFAELLASGQSKIGPPPHGRWREAGLIEPRSAPGCGRVPTANGGYIRDYQFDSSIYRIPPKQVQQANPAQMMLLDAVSQAIQEFDGGKWSFDRTRTGVVVGAVFGGEFSNQLQAGLRMPEMQRELRRLLGEGGCSEADIDDITQGFRSAFLKQRPALLDETGGFTASTLASRVAKTFDLMGGACAVDADQASSLCGLGLAVDYLRSGEWDQAICGVAQRNMDFSYFSTLDMQGRLLRSGDAAEISSDSSQILPGEGVAAVLLMRLEDARRRGAKILGILDEVDVAKSAQAGQNGQHPANLPDVGLIRQIGHLSGAHEVVRIVKHTLDWEAPGVRTPENLDVRCASIDGIEYRAALRSPRGPERRPPTVPVPTVTAGSPQPVSPPRTASATSRRPPTATSPDIPNMTRLSISASPHAARAVKLSAADPAALAERVQEARHRPAEVLAGESQFRCGDGCRVTVLAAGAEELATRLAGVARALEKGRRRGVLETDRAVLWTAGERAPRIAWLFPGQGSQYSGIPCGLAQDPAARNIIDRLDEELRRHGRETFSAVLAAEHDRVARDIWSNQLWMLGGSLALAAQLAARGDRPDLVAGHSFGEYAALATAGVIDPAQAVRMVKARADAVTMTVREPGQLISVRGAPHRVEAIIRERKLPALVTHYNAPQQTVIAADVAHVEAVRAALNAENLASLVVSVPVAYHTPRLAAAQEALGRSFSAEPLLPPHCGFISTTTSRYASEPDELREVLVGQMTRPVLFVPTIERLVRDGFDVLLEVGPNQILTKLCFETVGERALCFALDVPQRDPAERFQLWDAVQDTVRPHEWVHARRVDAAPQLSMSPVSDRVDTPPPAASPRVVDLRRKGRKQPAGELVERDEVRPANGRPHHNGHGAHADIVVDRAVSVPPVPRLPQPPAVAPAAAPRPDFDAAALEKLLLSVVVDLTGYSADVIDFDADLEADLGVDSIKKAQVVGELAEHLRLTVAPKEMKLGDLHTLRQILQLGQQLATVSSPEVSDVPVAIQANNGQSPARPPLDAPSQSPPRNRLSIERFLIDLVVDQTGYAPEVVDLDADMEGDLGIDSIKQAQLLGEIQQQFDLTGVDARRARATSFTTLRSILEYLENELPDGGAAAFRMTPGAPDDSPLVSPEPARAVNRLEGVPAAAHERPPVFVPPSSPGANGKHEIVGSESSVALAEETVRGVTLCDEIPDEWRDLFRSQDPLTLGPVCRLAAKLRGRQHRPEIRGALRLLVELSPVESPVDEAEQCSPTEFMLGLAEGAGVNVEAVRAACLRLDPSQRHRSDRRERDDFRRDPSSTRFNPNREDANKAQAPSVIDPPPGLAELDPHKTMRFALRMVPAPRRSGTPTVPRFHGPALIVGRNPLALELQRRFSQTGFACRLLPDVNGPGEVDAILESLWRTEFTPHLFLATPHDADALTRLDSRAWQSRRPRALEVPYRVCQLWMQKLIDAGRMHEGSVVALTSLGGDFGFSGRHVRSPEGGLGALVKAMMIEGWMRGVRHTPMKVIDLSPDTSPQQAVEQVWRELAVTSYDPEIGIRGNERFVVQPAHVPSADSPRGASTKPHISRGGVWVVTGGGRGITAVAARELARRHDLQLELISVSPVPDLTDEIREAAARDVGGLRREIRAAANDRGENGMEAWRKIEKALEIESTLRACREAGVRARYRSCDVSDVESLRTTLDDIRRESGPIRGVIHGAGFGQDARFDRKRPDKVAQCLAAKIDGGVNLMDLTRGDPLDWFVAFGSISGRFGANGHTDYSLANDTLAKLVDRYRSERPDVRSVAFHWHAWGDIGMATKPETRLALEMIGMKFMPAEEGLSHFLDELERGGDEPEVLITDRNYFRKFFTGERGFEHPSRIAADRRFPLLDPDETGRLPPEGPFEVRLDPARERFLQQHQVDGTPVLPFVFAIELMAEAARQVTGLPHVTTARHVEALQAIKFSSGEPQSLRIACRKLSPTEVECRLLGDIVRRDGRLVTRDREFFRGEFVTTAEPPQSTLPLPSLDDRQWYRLGPPDPELRIQHGPDLNLLVAVTGEGRTVHGTIAASANAHLGGEWRPTTGWSVPCAALDACLYSCAFPERLYEQPSLPVSFERIEFGRLPDPGESCLVTTQLLSRDRRGAQLQFVLQGQNGDVLMKVGGYRIAFLGGE